MQPINYYQFLLTGGTGLTGQVPDSRVTGVTSTPPYSALPGGPFQYTNTATFPYDSYANSPVHRFYQMWQQEDCNGSYATATNPSGCLHDYFTWTEVTVGSSNNGKLQPSPFWHVLPAWLRLVPVRVRPPWASTTCNMAMRRTPSTSPTITPSATTITSLQWAAPAWMKSSCSSAMPSGSAMSTAIPLRLQTTS